MEEEERGNAGGRGGAPMEENDRDDNRRRRSGNIKPNVNKVQQVEGIDSFVDSKVGRVDE